MFKDIKKKIDKCIEYSINGIVNHAVDVLVNESPVWTGKYVKSHIAEETAREYPRDMVAEPPPYPPKTEETGVKNSTKIKLKSTAISIMKQSGIVAINNKAGHAVFVEHLGWKISKARFPFGQTKGSTMLNQQRILSKAKHKAFKR